MVTEEGLPKLLDFGIAKLLDPAQLENDPARTATMMRMMTPDYASPEQVRGLPITAATDIYSLGAVLYELLTGARAHKLETYTPTEIERIVCETEIAQESLSGDTESEWRQQRWSSPVCELAENGARLDALGNWRRSVATRWWLARRIFSARVLTSRRCMSSSGQERPR